MDRKNRIGIFIFTLGVLMLLMRPFLVYQITTTESYKNNPAHAWSLLQRLVKKKDDKHEQNAEVSRIMVLTQKTAISSIYHFANTIIKDLPSYHISWYQQLLHHCFQPGAP